MKKKKEVASLNSLNLLKKSNLSDKDFKTRTRTLIFNFHKTYSGNLTPVKEK
jgi:hypothetical protein